MDRKSRCCIYLLVISITTLLTTGVEKRSVSIQGPKIHHGVHDDLQLVYISKRCGAMLISVLECRSRRNRIVTHQMKRTGQDVLAFDLRCTFNTYIHICTYTYYIDRITQFIRKRSCQIFCQRYISNQRRIDGKLRDWVKLHYRIMFLNMYIHKYVNK